MTQADVRRPDLVSVGLSAGTAGIVLSSLLSPFELVKVDRALRHMVPLALLIVRRLSCTCQPGRHNALHTAL